MKRITKFLAAVLVLVGSGLVVSADAPVSPGLSVIATDYKLIKTGVAGSEIYFSADDFKNGLGLEKVSKITITSLPPREAGILKLGSLEVFSGQTIAEKNLSSLRFVPSGKTEIETSFGFTYGKSGAAGYDCEVFALERINSAPVVTQPGEITTGVFSGISSLGSVSAADPDGDQLKFEIISSPSHGRLTFTDPSLGYYVYTPDADYKGRDSFTLRAVDRYGAASNTVKVSLKIDTPQASEIFSDLDGHWANAAVIACERAGIIESGDKFYPDEPMSRAEFLDFMMKAAGYNGFAAKSTGFSDDDSIPGEYKGSVALAATLGVISGVEIDGKLCFCPNNQITRAEAAVIVSRLTGIGADESIEVSAIGTDESVPVWARASMSALRSAGLMRGEKIDGKSTLAPYDVITRAASAQLAAAMIASDTVS